MVNTQITFELKNCFSELDTLGEKLDQFCCQLGLTNRCLCEINLALEELFTNIISYGYDDEAEHWVKFTLSYQNGTIRMEVEDDGIPFEEKMKELSQTLYGQMKEAKALDNTIRQNLEVLGYGE